MVHCVRLNTRLKSNPRKATRTETQLSNLEYSLPSIPPITHLRPTSISDPTIMLLLVRPPKSSECRTIDLIFTAAIHVNHIDIKGRHSLLDKITVLKYLPTDSLAFYGAT